MASSHWKIMVAQIMRYTSVKMMTILSSYVRCEVCDGYSFPYHRPAMEIHQQLLAEYSKTRMSIQLVRCWMKYYHEEETWSIQYTMQWSTSQQDNFQEHPRCAPSPQRRSLNVDMWYLFVFAVARLHHLFLLQNC